MKDGFGEVGFSLMDHFCNPKPAYYYLKRAYSPVRMILKRGDGCVRLFMTNSSQTPYSGSVSCGYTDFWGRMTKVTDVYVELEPFAPATLVLELEDKGLDTENGVVFASAKGLDSVTLYDREFRMLCLPKKPALTVKDILFSDGELSFTVETDTFAHGVHFNLDESIILSDCYFDLLPGESKRIWAKCGEMPESIIPDCVFLK